MLLIKQSLPVLIVDKRCLKWYNRCMKVVAVHVSKRIGALTGALNGKTQHIVGVKIKYTTGGVF